MTRPRAIHQGRGVYYGVVGGLKDANNKKWKTVWAVSRPHNIGKFAKAEHGTDALLHIDIASGKILGEQPLDSRFTHDAFRLNGGQGDLLIADTSKGNVLR